MLHLQMPTLTLLHRLFRKIFPGILWDKKKHEKKNYLNELENNKIWKVKELTLDALITHGPDASVSGHIIAMDNSAFSFCDVYRFKNAGGTTIFMAPSFLFTGSGAKISWHKAY